MLQIRLLEQFDVRLNGKRILIPSRASAREVAPVPHARSQADFVCGKIPPSTCWRAASIGDRKVEKSSSKYCASHR